MEFYIPFFYGVISVLKTVISYYTICHFFMGLFQYFSISVLYNIL